MPRVQAVSYALIADGIESTLDIFSTTVVWGGLKVAARPPELPAKIRAVAKELPEVVDVEKCRVRKSGLTYFVDIHVMVDGEISVTAGHDIAHRVKHRLLTSSLNISDVAVHIEPA